MQKEAPKEIDTFAVDGDIVAYRCAAVREGNNVKALFETLDEFLFNIVRETGVSKLMVFLSNGSNFRYDIAKTKPYKGNRKAIVRPRHLEIAKTYLADMYGAISVPNYEADDAIASYMTQHPGVAHAGIDKDIRQVQGWHYNFVKRHWEYTSEDESVLKQFRQACMGDTSDNIPGLPGIGEKKAAKAITDPYKARDDAMRLYRNTMLTMNKEQVQEYFDEQLALVTMVDTLEIDYDKHVVVSPPNTFENHSEEGAFIGIEDEPDSELPPKPKLNLT